MIPSCGRLVIRGGIRAASGACKSRSLLVPGCFHRQALIVSSQSNLPTRLHRPHFRTMVTEAPKKIVKELVVDEQGIVPPQLADGTMAQLCSIDPELGTLPY